MLNHRALEQSRFAAFEREARRLCPRRSNRHFLNISLLAHTAFSGCFHHLLTIVFCIRQLIIWDWAVFKRQPLIIVTPVNSAHRYEVDNARECLLVTELQLNGNALRAEPCFDLLTTLRNQHLHGLIC